MRSLRRRAILGGVVWAILIVTIGGVALFSFFDSLTERRFDQALAERHLQVVIALSNSSADTELMSSFINDPAYERPYSGRYWQANGPNDEVLASRSLFDSVLPEIATAPTAAEFWTGEGPNGAIRGVRQSITLEDGTPWVVLVANSLDALMAERKEIRQSLIVTFGFVGVLGIAGAMLQTLVVISPLRKLREDVAHRWDLETNIDPATYPEEVAPLVSDINTLLERNREIVARGRRQAADMAHALKTPSAILRNELETLRQSKADVSQAQDALNRIDAQVNRSLARIRAANSDENPRKQTDLRHSLERLARLFRAMPENLKKQMKLSIGPDIAVPMDAQDLEEVLGNILENAFYWSKRRVVVTGRKADEFVEVLIEDDGPGIPESDRREALRSGGRLDTSVPGTGLGLAIAGDLLQAYGGAMALRRSGQLGGLCVEIRLSVKPGLELKANDG